MAMGLFLARGYERSLLLKEPTFRHPRGIPPTRSSRGSRIPAKSIKESFSEPSVKTCPERS